MKYAVFASKEKMDFFFVAVNESELVDKKALLKLSENNEFIKCIDSLDDFDLVCAKENETTEVENPFAFWSRLSHKHSMIKTRLSLIKNAKISSIDFYKIAEEVNLEIPAIFFKKIIGCEI